MLEGVSLARELVGYPDPSLHDDRLMSICMAVCQTERLDYADWYDRRTPECPSCRQRFYLPAGQTEALCSHCGHRYTVDVPSA